MIDLQSEQLIAVKDIPRHVPGRPHIATCYRWIQRPSNPLETVRVGGRRFTSVEALHRFIARCTGDETLTPVPTKARQREIARAEKELENAGI